MSVSKTRPDVSQDTPADDAHAPRPLSFAENVVLTLKLLAGVGVLGGLLWAAKVWTAVE